MTVTEYDPPIRATADDTAAYFAGFCKICHVNRFQAGCTMCEECFPAPAMRVRQAKEFQAKSAKGKKREKKK